MEKIKTSTSDAPKLISIEELKGMKLTPDRVFQGAKAANGWRLGKAVTEEDYDAAMKGFLQSPAGGRKVKKDAKRR